MDEQLGDAITEMPDEELLELVIERGEIDEELAVEIQDWLEERVEA